MERDRQNGRVGEREKTGTCDSLLVFRTGGTLAAMRGQCPLGNRVCPTDTPKSPSLRLPALMQ